MQPDAREAPRSRPPHCFLARKDPSQRVVAIASQKRRRPQIAPCGLHAPNARKISRNTSEITSGCCTPKSDQNPHRHAGFPTTSRLLATTPNVNGNCRLPQFSVPSAGARRPIPVPSASDARRLSGHRQSGSRSPSTDIVVLASRRGVAVLLPATEPTAWSPASGRWQQGREESGRPVAQLPGFPMACV